jgi:general secretion pathway protein K
MSISNQRGAVLLLVLVVVALLSALLTDWAFSTLVDMRLTETFRDSNRAYYLARGGVEVGRQLLAMDNDLLFDAPTEMWGVGVPAYPVSDEATVSISIVDEDSRFNLNQLVDTTGYNSLDVGRERFERLLTALDIKDPEALSHALTDWIDKNDVPFSPGAENSWYQGLTPPLACKNGFLDTVDELLLVKGFTPEIVQKLTPYVTAVTVAAVTNLNVNTASRELLLAWHKDLTASGIDQLLTARQKKPFQTLQEVQAAIDTTNYGNLAQQKDISVASQFYRITSVAQVNDGMRTVETLLKRDKGTKVITPLWRRVY